MAGDQRCHQRQQSGEIGGQVHVHVRQHGRVRLGPGRLQCPAAALLHQPQEGHLGVLVVQRRRDRRGPVGARVIHDGDPVRVGEVRRQVAMQPVHRRPQVDLLVIDRDDHVQDGSRRVQRQYSGAGRLG